MLKIFDENSIEKLNFYFIFIFILLFNFIFRKFVTKNRAFGNNTSFLQQFSVVSGGFLPSPGYALGSGGPSLFAAPRPAQKCKFKIKIQLWL